MNQFEPNEYLLQLQRMKTALMIAHEHAQNLSNAIPDALPSIKNDHRKIINTISDLIIQTERIYKQRTHIILSINSIQQ